MCMTTSVEKVYARTKINSIFSMFDSIHNEECIHKVGKNWLFLCREFHIQLPFDLSTDKMEKFQTKYCEGVLCLTKHVLNFGFWIGSDQQIFEISPFHENWLWKSNRRNEFINRIGSISNMQSILFSFFFKFINIPNVYEMYFVVFN